MIYSWFEDRNMHMTFAYISRLMYVKSSSLIRRHQNKVLFCQDRINPNINNTILDYSLNHCLSKEEAKAYVMLDHDQTQYFSILTVIETSGLVANSLDCRM